MVENMSHFITGRKYVHFAYWSKECPSKKRPGAEFSSLSTHHFKQMNHVTHLLD